MIPGVLAVGAGSTLASSPIELSAITAGTGGFALNGEAAGDYSGFSVSGAGDVNGDGLADLIVGADRAHPNGTKSGRSYVIFGKSDTTTIDLSSVTAGSGGFVINGEAVGDYSGFSVSGAGDVNGDGLADLLVGARGASPNGMESGRTYVVFGKTSTTPVNLSAVRFGLGGFAINGQTAYDFSGSSVAAAGDVNGDGLDDLIIGAYGSDLNQVVPVRRSLTGRSYVVFGKTTTTAVNLSAIAAGSGGFVINGEAYNDFSGWSVSRAGDVNGDGRSDLVVGSWAASPNGHYSGRTYVIFGKASTTPVNLSSVAAGSGGFAINGQAINDSSGWSVSGGADINGDGRSDIVLGADLADPSGSNSGRTYVVFGKSNTTSVNLSAVAAGTGGFVINGEAALDYSGRSVSLAGDVNGDGLADIIIGAYKSDPGGTDSGRSYVVFGKSTTTPVNLSDITAGTGGFVLNGEAAQDRSGHSVFGAGDVNGDGLDDLIIGAYRSDATGSQSGRSYVVFSPETRPARIRKALWKAFD